MNSTRTRLLVAASTTVLLGSLLGACSGDANTDGNGPEGPATSTPVPGQGSAENPFDSSLTGPRSGTPGETITETLTNTGRLPDGYQVTVDPPELATVKNGEVRLGPGESAQVQITIRGLPFDVHLKSIGGGAPDVVAFTVG
ncbi:hypothetical protein H5V45_20080 [Nocardioides sp. KIGAM211]|uniref:Uncharacterized protein n=1 Tax=Nocardioides luti TaxID=2761101 RepID=A0A7X0RJS1_9ACTN|nr:hypothetical protein [Nocardioides luti]MBB6629628.1 hypothetical protein [Nocardioides luti]